MPQSKPKFRRRADARPDEVLDAALRLFSEQGYAKTTVEQIARRAGLSKGAVYLYFPSKDALLEGLVKRAVQPVAVQMIDAISGYRGDPRLVLRNAMFAMLGFMQNPDFAAVPKLILHEAVTAPVIAQMYRAEVLDRALPALTALLAQGVVGGFIRPIDPELTVRSVIGPIMLHILLAEVFAICPTDGLAMQRMIDNHLTILCAGLEPERTPV